MSSTTFSTAIPLLGLARPAGRRPTDDMTAEAFAAVYRRTAPGLRAFVRRSLGAADASVVEDIVQEAYLRLLRSGFESTEPRVERTYLYRIAANLMRDRHRRRRPESAIPEEGSGGEPGDRSVRAGLRRDVSKLFARLSPKDRQLLWLAHVEQHSHREIAEVLGLREPSVRVLLLRARRRLAELLDGEGIGPEVLS